MGCQSCSRSINSDDFVPMEIQLQLRLSPLSTANASDSSTKLHRHIKSYSILHPLSAHKNGVIIGYQRSLIRLSFLPWTLPSRFMTFNSLSSISITTQ